MSTHNDQPRRREVFELLDEMAKIKYKDDRIAAVKANKHQAIWNVLAMALDPRRNWAIPRERPPFTPCGEHNYPTSLHREADKLRYFMKNPGDNMNQMRREKIVIGMLETIHPKDAELLAEVIAGRWPYDKKLGRDIVEAACPALFGIGARIRDDA